MKKFAIIVFILVFPLYVTAQDMFRVEFDRHQFVENVTGALGSHVNLPVSNNIIIIGGLNDLDGMGNYFNIYGSKLIIDNHDINADGTQRVTLRREDGDNFFDLFSTVSATLIPIEQNSNKTIIINP